MREGECDDEDIKRKILERHNKNLFKMKRLALPSYLPYFMKFDYSDQVRKHE